MNLDFQCNLIKMYKKNYGKLGWNVSIWEKNGVRDGVQSGARIFQHDY
jgi:hypothetical protein